jgi:purine-binding chemotaxis protein CheW
MAAPAEAGDRDASPEGLHRGRCISVFVGGAAYGLPLDQVQEVISMRPLTRVFHSPAAVAGVTSLRGDVLPVLDLAVMLGVEAVASASRPTERIVVVREQQGARRRAGLRVDDIGGLRDAPPTGLATPPTTLAEAARELVVGVIPDSPPCSVLDVTRLLDAPELAELAGA